MNRFASSLIAAALAVAAANVARAPVAVERFDYLVREDMFRGFAGDAAAFDRAMALCGARLAENPDHAEALVWHGTGLLFKAARAFRDGDAVQGAALNRAGLTEMAKAVALRPDDVAVLIPRGAVTLAFGLRIRDAQRARPYFETAVADFEKVLILQQPYLERLASHPKGELLAGLAEGWARLDEPEKSRLYLARMVNELPGTPYAKAAATRLETSDPAVRITCLGCHAN
jgi:hypothetical protein